MNEKLPLQEANAAINTWIKPELKVISVKENTFGAAGTHGDGGGSKSS